MTYTPNTNDKLIDVHINNLNSIQKTISRLSNIGYILFSSVIGIDTIIFPVIFLVNISWYIRLTLSLIFLILIILFFIAHLVNLRNERLWIKIYNDKCKLDIEKLKSENKISEVLETNFQQLKKSNIISLKSCLKSFWTICWAIIFILGIAVSILTVFI